MYMELLWVNKQADLFFLLNQVHPWLTSVWMLVYHLGLSRFPVGDHTPQCQWTMVKVMYTLDTDRQKDKWTDWLSDRWREGWKIARWIDRWIMDRWTDSAFWDRVPPPLPWCSWSHGFNSCYSEFLFVPRLCHVDQFTFRTSSPS